MDPKERNAATQERDSHILLSRDKSQNRFKGYNETT